MGSEIIFLIFPVLLLALFLGVAYALLYRFRSVSRAARIVLGFILNTLGIMLFLISLFSVFAIVFWIGAALFGDIEPSSDRFVFLGVAIILGIILTLAWRGLLVMSRHLEASPPDPTNLASEP